MELPFFLICIVVFGSCTSLDSIKPWSEEQDDNVKSDLLNVLLPYLAEDNQDKLTELHSKYKNKLLELKSKLKRPVAIILASPEEGSHHSNDKIIYLNTLSTPELNLDEKRNFTENNGSSKEYDENMNNGSQIIEDISHVDGPSDDNDNKTNVNNVDTEHVNVTNKGSEAVRSNFLDPKNYHNRIIALSYISPSTSPNPLMSSLHNYSPSSYTFSFPAKGFGSSPFTSLSFPPTDSGGSASSKSVPSFSLNTASSPSLESSGSPSLNSISYSSLDGASSPSLNSISYSSLDGASLPSLNSISFSNLDGAISPSLNSISYPSLDGASSPSLNSINYPSHESFNSYPYSSYSSVPKAFTPIPFKKHYHHHHRHHNYHYDTTPYPDYSGVLGDHTNTTHANSKPAAAPHANSIPYTVADSFNTQESYSTEEPDGHLVQYFKPFAFTPSTDIAPDSYSTSSGTHSTPEPHSASTGTDITPSSYITSSPYSSPQSYTSPTVSTSTKPPDPHKTPVSTPSPPSPSTPPFPPPPPPSPCCPPSAPVPDCAHKYLLSFLMN